MRPHIEMMMDVAERPFLSEPSLMLLALKSATERPSGAADCLRRLERYLAVAGEKPLADQRDVVRRRVESALRYLSLAGMLEPSADGRYAITARGRDALRAHPHGIDLSVLAEYPDFRAHIRRSRQQTLRREAGLAVLEPTAKYREGYAAFGDGGDLTDNPYDLETAAHLEWENGWSEAREESLKSERLAG